MSQDKTTLKKLVSEGKIQAAINALLSIEMSENRKKEVLAISSRFKKLKEQSNLGVLTYEQENITENQITASLIDLINRYDKEDVIEENESSSIPASKSILAKYVIGAMILAVVLFGLLEIGNIIDIVPNNETMQLTVFVTDAKGNPALENEGKLNIPLGNRSLNEVIGANGRTNFSDITGDNKGDTIRIGLDAEGWEIIAGNNTFVFDGEPINLKVQRDNSLGLIKGVVMSRDGQEFISNAEVRINASTIVRTDANGIFETILPEDLQVKALSEAYNLTISADSYKTTSQYYFPKTTADIRLEKK